MGEHGKRPAPKAAVPAPKAAAPVAATAAPTQSGHNRAAKVQKDRSRRWGPLTAETGIVLGVAAAIVAGAFMMEHLQPSGERTNTVNGNDTVKIHNLGKGGVVPGTIQPRTIVQKPITPTTPTGVPTTTAKPGKTPKPQVTAAPTTAAPGTGGVIPDPGGGTSGGNCSVAQQLLGQCPKPSAPPTTDPDPSPVASPEPTEADTENSTNTVSKTESKAPAPKKAKAPTPAP